MRKLSRWLDTKSSPSPRPGYARDGLSKGRCSREKTGYTGAADNPALPAGAGSGGVTPAWGCSLMTPSQTACLNGDAEVV